MAHLPQPGEQFGRYRIVTRIGKGGMGSVFEARESGLDRPVALKVLSSELADEPAFRSRFLREARVLASLDSPHVIQVYEQGEYDDRLYIATQLVKGSDLHQLLQATGPLPVARALGLIAQVADGLSDAHAAGLIHRDVKPSNVLVRTGRDEDFAYLCDFGIAVSPDSHHTRTSGVIGTVDYMAPERHEGREATTASDIYSLGCVLWAALSGRAPYAGTSAVRVAMAHMSAPVPVYVGSSPAVRLVNGILDRSMAKDPARRYASTAEMRREVLDAFNVDLGRSPAPDLRHAVTTVSPPPLSATEIRAQPAPFSVPAATPTSGDTRARTRSKVAIAGAVLAIIAVGGTGFGLANRDGGGDPSTALGSTPSPSVATTPTAGATPSNSAKTTKSSGATATVTTTVIPPAAPGTSAAPPLIATSESAVTMGTVICWDGSAAADQTLCSVPSGRAGLSTVFPSLGTDSSCEPISASVSGKVEVYECVHGDVLLRYSRWAVGSDKFAYYDQSNGVPGSAWFIGEEFAGREWSSYDSSVGETRGYQWSAAYRYSPFSVSVEGASQADLTAGKRLVQFALPSHIGLR